MFVDFNRVFNNKPQTQISAPLALISYLNKTLPAGVKYIADESGNCRIAGKNGSITVGGIIFTPTKKQKQVLGKNYTQEDVIDYFYNIQKPIPIQLKKDGYILLNGEEFPIGKMSYHPLLGPIRYVSGSFCMYPPPFPEPFSLKVGCDKYERELFVSRVINDSVYISAFESNKDESLYIRFFIDKRDEKITFNISFNLQKAKTIRDIVESTSIYNAFLKGKGILFEQPFDDIKVEKNAKLFDEDSVVFWEKVLEIEKVLDVKFQPPLGDIDQETIYLVEQLYQNLVKKNPTRDNQIINSVDGRREHSTKTLDEMVEKPLYFEFEATYKMKLFGVEKELPAIMGVFNARLESYTQKGDKEKITFADESPKKHRYTSVMYFKTEKDLKTFRSGDHKQIVDLLSSAKNPHEYL